MTPQALLRAFTLTVVALATVIPVRAAEDAGRKPNIVYIMADDLGYTDVACYGSKYYETPNIDRLAAEGLKFTSGYTCGPNCQPTRAALLTGQYGPRTGTYTVGNINRFDWSSRPLRPVDNVAMLPLDKILIPQTLKSAGYATAMFGKWHLGNKGPHHPGQRGFDEAIESSGKHFDFTTDPQVDVPKGQYLADFLTDKAVDFIRRKKDGPFFLYLPHFGVHGPHQAKPELIAKFKDKPAAGGHHNPTYAAMIYSVDESVGRILATLDELKLADNTLVIFTSDNGGVGGYQRAGVKKGGPAGETTDNAPLRGGKGMLYEGGVRVPFIFRWPGRIQPGSTSDEPIASVDLYPTFAELAAASRPPGYALDGVSLTPVLMNASANGGAKSLGRDAIYWHFPGYLGAGQNDWRTLPVGAVRSGDYKLLEFFEDGRLELYNLKADLGQANNLAEKEPAKAKELHAKLVAWRESVGAKMPTKNTGEDPASGKQRQRKRNRQAESDDE